MTSQTSFQPNYTVAPGAVLNEHRDAAGLTQAELAQRLGFSVKHVNRILAGLEPVTPETALKLESIFGLGAGIWLGLEAKYQEQLAKSAEMQTLETEKAWLTNIPHRSMAKLGWIPKECRGVDLVRSLRSFFGVGSLDYLPKIWADVQAAYRKSEAFASHEWAMLAWLARGKREAESIQVNPHDSTGLRDALPEIKALSRLPGVTFVENLIEQCAKFGVVLVFIPAPEGARVCGATRWLDKDRALVQLSLRYKTDDQLWFTLFHELGHVLLHGKREQFIDFDRLPSDSEAEKEANDFAARQLVNPNDLNRFIAASDFSVQAVRRFAAQQVVADGIVVGQLQFRGVVPYKSPLSRLKVSFRFDSDLS